MGRFGTFAEWFQTPIVAANRLNAVCRAKIHRAPRLRLKMQVLIYAATPAARSGYAARRRMN